MRPFEANDVITLNRWLKLREMPSLDPSKLPKTGLIESDIACGFLIQTDCSFAFLEFFVSNPQYSQRERLDALWKIGAELVEIARRRGYKGLCCNTKFGNVRDMAESQQFVYTGEFSTYFREIS